METRMTTHRFRVGQKVQLSSHRSRMAATGAYEVVRQLPDSAGELYYRIKSTREEHDPRSARHAPAMPVNRKNGEGSLCRAFGLDQLFRACPRQDVIGRTGSR